MATRQEQNDFANLIFKIVKTKQITYLEAIIEYCETTGLEISVAASLVNQNLKHFLRQDGEDINLLSKSGRLPI